MSEVRTNSITDAAGTGAPDFPNGINSAGNIGLEGTTPAIVFAETDTTDLDARVRLQGGDLLFETVTDANTLVRENMRIADSGFVGIGTDTPNNLLDVAGAAEVLARFYRTDSTLALLRVSNSTTGDGSTSPEFGSDGTSAVIHVNNAERMKIDSSGDVTFRHGIIETVFALSGTTPALNPTNGTIQTWTLSGNSSPTDSLVAGESLTLMIDDGSAFTITWPSVTWKTNAGSAPTLNTTGFTVIVLWKVGSTLYGARVGDA